jgi:hypothetical protein
MKPMQWIGGDEANRYSRNARAKLADQVEGMKLIGMKGEFDQQMLCFQPRWCWGEAANNGGVLDRERVSPPVAAATRSDGSPWGG